VLHDWTDRNEDENKTRPERDRKDFPDYDTDASTKVNKKNPTFPRRYVMRDERLPATSLLHNVLEKENNKNAKLQGAAGLHNSTDRNKNHTSSQTREGFQNYKNKIPSKKPSSNNPTFARSVIEERRLAASLLHDEMEKEKNEKDAFDKVIKAVSSNPLVALT
jgi:hypothetical protein